MLRCNMPLTAAMHRVWMLLLLKILLESTPRASAQRACGATRADPIEVRNETGVDILRAATSCNNGGVVKADWIGRVSIDAQIAVGEGTFLSVTGEHIGSEVHTDGSQTRFFHVSPGGSLTLTRLKLRGGSAEGGGAICSQSANLVLDNCTFDGNVATDGNGGAVWAQGANVTIVGGELLANNATNYGGALYVVEGRLVVKGGSRFQGNTALVGGALFSGVEEGGASKPAAYCSITDSTFVGNTATHKSRPWIQDLDLVVGGGAAMFRSARVEITDSEFSWNHAMLSGGALHGGLDTNISVDGCMFGNNTSGRLGGAITAYSLTLGGDTHLADNSADDDGGAVFGWNGNGTIVFRDVICEHNSADFNGGCFYGFGRTIFHDGTVMHHNSGIDGGSIFAAEGSDISVRGGTFTSGSCERGGVIYAADRNRIHINGGLFENSIATKRGGALYVNGGQESDVWIGGGTFRNNKAYEMGGAIVVSGAPALVTITGGTFENNAARYYGGFTFLEGAISFSCEGGTIQGNSAGDQGGGIYARLATWVNSSCQFIENESPQGAAIYLTHVKSATFNNHNVTDNSASGGSMVFVAATPVVATGVTFESSGHLHEYSFNRAVQLDRESALEADTCMFDGWLGDTVIFNANSADGSLILNSCDFSRSSAVVAVISPNSDAEIRNAFVSNLTFENAVVVNSSALVDRALDCNDSNACGAGECVDSLLGVLCECLDDGECLNDGSELSLSLTSPPDAVTVSPVTVSYEIELSAAATGTTSTIWDLEFEGGDLELYVIPSSGVLHPGGSITISVHGVPSTSDVGGKVTNSFYVNSRSNASAGGSLDVIMTLYLCPAYEFAMPVDGRGDDIVSCKQCAIISGEEGVDCTAAGATQNSLPILQGFWRSSTESMEVHKCLHSDACVGATKVAGSDDYCADGYKGPYCAVCAEGYGRGLSNSCHFCSNTKDNLLFSTGALVSLVMLLLLSLAVVFLVGGLDAIEFAWHSVCRVFFIGRKASSSGAFEQEDTLHEGSCSGTGRRVESLDATIARSFVFESGRIWSDVHCRMDSLDAAVVPGFSFDSGGQHGWDKFGFEDPTGRSETVWMKNADADDLDRTHVRHPEAILEVGMDSVDAMSRNTPWNAGLSVGRNARFSPVAGTSICRTQASKSVSGDVATNGGTPRDCGLGKKINCLVSRLPLNKLKILVVVWQILAVCSSITGIEFPVSYARFLAWINIANFDLGDLFSASCILSSVNFYQRLLVTTLTPLALTAVLALTYHMANHRGGLGRAGANARRSAWSRHVAAGLLLTFLVFTSASTVSCKTFACDDGVGDGQSYLRADYSLTCYSDLHVFFQAYAGLMILVYPIGIPVLYATILWKNRELLNPRIDSQPVGEDGHAKHKLSPQELQDLDERVKARRANPALVPSMFLWKDFGPDLYYYEVIECGRRMLLTGVLIFIAPHTKTQVAMACMFAFVSILGFELMRPHMDPTDSWLYRLGCVIIFLSNFLALLIKAKAGEESDRAAFGTLLVAVNVLLVLAVLVTSWLAVQQSVDDHRDGENSLAIAKTMLTAEQDTTK